MKKRKRNLEQLTTSSGKLLIILLTLMMMSSSSAYVIQVDAVCIPGFNCPGDGQSDPDYEVTNIQVRDHMNRDVSNENGALTKGSTWKIRTTIEFSGFSSSVCLSFQIENNEGSTSSSYWIGRYKVSGGDDLSRVRTISIQSIYEDQYGYYKSMGEGRWKIVAVEISGTIDGICKSGDEYNSDKPRHFYTMSSSSTLLENARWIVADKNPAYKRVLHRIILIDSASGIENSIADVDQDFLDEDRLKIKFVNIFIYHNWNWINVPTFFDCNRGEGGIYLFDILDDSVEDVISAPWNTIGDDRVYKNQGFDIMIGTFNIISSNNVGCAGHNRAWITTQSRTASTTAIIKHEMTHLFLEDPVGDGGHPADGGVMEKSLTSGDGLWFGDTHWGIETLDRMEDYIDKWDSHYYIPRISATLTIDTKFWDNAGEVTLTFNGVELDWESQGLTPYTGSRSKTYSFDITTFLIEDFSRNHVLIVTDGAGLQKYKNVNIYIDGVEIYSVQWTYNYGSSIYNIDRLPTWW